MILYPLRKHDSPSKALEFGKTAYWTETSNDTDGWQIHRLAIKNAETQKVLAQPEVRERLEREGAELIPGPPEKLGALIAADLDRWKKLIAEANLKLE